MAVKDLKGVTNCVFICNGGCCMKEGAEEVTMSLRAILKQQNLEDQYHTVRTKCMGRCDDAPVALIIPDNIWIKKIIPDQCHLLLNHLQANTLQQSSLYLYKMGDQFINSDSIPTKYRKQQ